MSGDNRIFDNKKIKSESLINFESISIDDLSLINGIDFLKIDKEGVNYLFYNEQEIIFYKLETQLLIENNNFQELYEFF